MCKEQEEEEGMKMSCFAQAGNLWKDLEMSVVISVCAVGWKRSLEIRNVKTRQKAYQLHWS